MIGFGVKGGRDAAAHLAAGAHANAPSHVSAMMSGVMLKAGVYGMIRVAGIFPHPPTWCGATLLIVGSISGILGIAFAVSKRLQALTRL